MASRTITTITTITDDLEGNDTPAAETITFALDGAIYEIDLSKTNATRLREQLSPWTKAARAGAKTPRRRTPVSNTPGHNAAVRQ